MAIIRHSIIFITLAVVYLTATACSSASKEKVIATLNKSIQPNEEFKKSVDGKAEEEYRHHRKKVETYEESIAIPCLRRALALLTKTADMPLVNALFAHALSHENSSDETESDVLAKVFILHEDAFTSALTRSPPKMKDAVLSRVDRGWAAIKSRQPVARRNHVEDRLTRLKDQ